VLFFEVIAARDRLISKIIVSYHKGDGVGRQSKKASPTCAELYVVVCVFYVVLLFSVETACKRPESAVKKAFPHKK
jgi:hypothetical protein